MFWQRKGPFRIRFFCFGKHFSGTISHKYLLTTLCFPCFSKLNLLVGIEWGVDAFGVTNLLGKFPREHFFSGVCCFIMIWWKHSHFNKTCQVCLACSPLADCNTPAQATGRQQPAVPLYINNPPQRILKIRISILGFLESKQKLFLNIFKTFMQRRYTSSSPGQFPDSQLDKYKL